MSRRKKAIMYTLIGLNILLLVALVHVNLGTAQAATFKTTDYALVTGKVSGSADGVFILDRAEERMTVITLDPTTKKLRKIGMTVPLNKIFESATPSR